MEESIVDPQNKTLTTYTRNLGYQTVMVCYYEDLNFIFVKFVLNFNAHFVTVCGGKSGV